MDKSETLQKYFGFDSFREGQEELIDCILSGKDCLGVMPTGGGKSLCYQVPALMMSGTTIVISPIISLMQDQVNHLARCGIEAASINSTMSSDEYRDVCRTAEEGRLKLLYVAPERLESKGFLDLCSHLSIPLIAVDEAHCVSLWGHSFRPSYKKIGEFIQKLEKRPVVAAFTGTATQFVKDDVISLLGQSDPFCVTMSFDRPNLYFEIIMPRDKDTALLQILKERCGSTIVYCATKNNVDAVAELLVKEGINAGKYHAGMTNEERAENQEKFMDSTLDVMVATNAFGMGIDKPDVGLVIHYNMPKDIESYYQEAGRAGRDGGNARCIMMYDKNDKELAKFMIDKESEDKEGFSKEELDMLKSNGETRLGAMTSLLFNKGCLRKGILIYFGEEAPDNCGNCENCCKDFATIDATVRAQKILSCIYRLNERDFRLGREYIEKILLGSEDEKISELKLTTLSTYGLMRGEKVERLRAIMDKLVEDGYFEVSGEDNVCVITQKGDEFVKTKQRYIIRVPKDLGDIHESSIGSIGILRKIAI